MFLQAGRTTSEVRINRNSGSETIRIVVIDGQNLFRGRIRNMIRGESGLRVVGTARSVSRGIQLIRRFHPHIALLGWRGHPEYAGESLALIKECSSSTRVIVLVGDSLENDLVGAIGQGCCDGILSRKTSTKLMIRSRRKVYSGEFWLKRMTTADVIRQLTKKAADWSQDEVCIGILRPAVLNPREREITLLVAQGFDNKRIAGRLFLTESAVENDLARLLEKLGVFDRLELALYAIYHRLHQAEKEAPLLHRSIRISDGVSIEGKC